MKKLIRDATFGYEIYNMVKDRRTGQFRPTKNKRKGKIEKLTTSKNIEEAQQNRRLLKDIARKYNKQIDDVKIKILSLDFGSWQAWSNDVY